MDKSAKKVTILDLHRMKTGGQKITMLTAFDFTMAELLDAAGVEMVLVGDSLAMVALGYESTVPVTTEEMLHHTKAVRRGVRRAFLVGDMPFMSYNVSPAQAIGNAGRFLKEAAADGVKVEGGREMAAHIEAVVEAGIPVLGHIGLTPQTVSKLSGYRLQGREAEGATRLIEDALAVQEAGAFAMVLECIPAEVASMITERLTIPTIGIGAGPDCDGQVLVTSDLLGLYGKFRPKFVKRYADLAAEAGRAFARFRQEVREGVFPGPEHSFRMEPAELKKLTSKKAKRGKK